MLKIVLEVFSFIAFGCFIYFFIIMPLLITVCPPYRRYIEKQTKKFYDNLT